MADSKLTALAETTAPATTDLLYVVTDPGGSATSKKVQIGNMTAVVGGRVLIAQSTPTGTGTVTFNSISGSYTHLIIELVGRTDKAAAVVSGGYLYFNNDTTAGNYERVSNTGNGVSVTSGKAANPDVMTFTAVNATANYPAYSRVWIPYYALTTFNKAASVETLETDASTAITLNNQFLSWHSTSAITRIDIVTDDSSNYITGTTFRLYGVM
jgi:hypothetical protein